MKTQTGVYWALRQWMLRGGAGTIAWFLGPELDRAFVLVEKWCDGEPGNPAVCPAELILHRPYSKSEPDPVIRLIDGSAIQVRHADAKRMTARSTVWWLWTEAATTSDIKAYARARGRLVSSKGQGYLDAVPEPRNWVKTAIIDAAQSEADEASQAERDGRSFHPSIRVQQLGARRNPWVDESEAADFERDLKRIDPRLAQREAGGEWVGDADLLFELDGSKVTFDIGPVTAASALDHLGFEDCTKQASLRWFTRPHDWIIATDVNGFPHTSLIGKMGCPKGKDPRVPKHWNAVFLDLMQVWGLDSEQAAIALRGHRNGRYAGAGVVMDATSAQTEHSATGALNSSKQIIPLRAFTQAGFETRGPRYGKPRPDKPPRFENPDRTDGTTVCRTALREARVHVDRFTCGDFLFALRNQEAEPDGITPAKRPNTLQDQYVASFVETFRYWMWPFFSMPVHVASGTGVTARTYG